MDGAANGRGPGSVSRRTHYGCALAGLSVTVAVAVALFGRLAALAEGLGVVGPAVLVVVVAFWWGVWWLALESAVGRARIE